MFDNLRSAAADTARRTAVGLAAGLSLLIGLLFLTLAAWIAIASVADNLTAALIIGAVYVGLALILLAFALTRQNKAKVYHPALGAPTSRNENVFNGIAAAFFEGLGAGLTARDQFSQSRGSSAPNGSDRS
ncbi:MAG: phage holin family protein [Paracoccaceae bacterium]